MITYNKGLSFDDITLIPRYSDLESRSDADPSSCGYDLPIAMSPMNTITSLDMMKLFVDRNLIATLHRYFKNAEEQLDYALEMGDAPQDVIDRECLMRGGSFEQARRYADHVYFAVGSVHTKKEWIDYLFKNGIHKFCVDMAMGNSKHCVDTVEYIKSLEYGVLDIMDGRVLYETTPEVMAGNVVTKNGMERLINAGATLIRCGIGCGCFTPEMKVRTIDGLKNISDIDNGDIVFTHTGQLKEVIGKLSYQFDDEIIVINGIESTKNHEYYVLNKRYKNVVNEDNIHSYAEWKRADELTKEYMLIELE